MSAKTVDEIMRLLVARGGRRTATRQAILEALASSGSHVTADELAAQVQARFPSVSLSTVYRTLDALEELGIIDHVHLGHGRAVYHLSGDDHQHLVCERCQGVEELPPRKLTPFLRMIERDFGFQVDRGHFAIVGVCRRCRGLAAQDRGKQ